MARQILMSQQFAITLTLNPKLFKHNVLQQRSILQGTINTIDASNKCTLGLCCEITQNGNIHAHGFVKVPLEGKKNPIFRIHDVFRPYMDIIGFICIKPITTYHNWLHYCLKEHASTVLELDSENPIIIDEMGDFSTLDESVVKILNHTCNCDFESP